MTDTSVNVYCEECGAGDLIDRSDRRSLQRAFEAVGIGWCVWRETDGEVKFLCPDHRDQEFKDRHQGEHAIEAR